MGACRAWRSVGGGGVRLGPESVLRTATAGAERTPRSRAGSSPALKRHPRPGKPAWLILPAAAAASLEHGAGPPWPRAPTRRAVAGSSPALASPWVRSTRRAREPPSRLPAVPRIHRTHVLQSFLLPSRVGGRSLEPGPYRSVPRLSPSSPAGGAPRGLEGSRLLESVRPRWESLAAGGTPARGGPATFT